MASYVASWSLAEIVFQPSPGALLLHAAFILPNLFGKTYKFENEHMNILKVRKIDPKNLQNVIFQQSLN